MHVTSNKHIKVSLFEKALVRGKYSPFFSWSRPYSYWDVVEAHLPLAIITGIVLLLPHLVSCHLLPLKQCTFLSLTGFPCPFCGFTRSFWAMAEGEWTLALNNSPIACLMYIAVLLIFVWNVTGLLVGLKIARGQFMRLSPEMARFIIIILIILLILNWVYRLSLGLK